MPPDHLPDLAAAVRAILAGAEPATIAAENDIHPNELGNAVRTYHAGGLAALEQANEHRWYDIRAEFPTWASAETTAISHLGPALDTLCSDGAISGWWFLRKYPCWRLRLHDANTAAADRILNNLVAAGHLTRWWPTIYEPETAAFGGTTGLTVIHDLFCADSHGVLNHLRHPAGLPRRELSILLLAGLFHSAGLDMFERGDVFSRVAHLRPTPAGVDTAKIDHLATVLRPALLNDPSRADLFAPTGPAAHSTDWLRAFQHAGRRLGDSAARGQLCRALRAILTHVTIFHWNRLGLPASSQAVLARAATIALLPIQRPRLLG